MTEITPQMLKTLRERTGVGMSKCKEALTAASGDMELAIENLRKAGIATAVKKEGRETKEGVIIASESAQSLVLVEVNCETDFVVKNERFQEFVTVLVKEAALMPSCLVSEFLLHKYPKDPSLTIDEFRATLVQALGENIQVRRVEFFPKKKNASLALYSHAGGKLVTLVEIEGSSAEEALAKEIAMHVAAESPEYLSPEEVPSRIIAHEKEIGRAQVQNKPANVIDKIVEGKLKAYFDQVCLLNQHFVKEPSLTISELVARRGKEVGKTLKLTQFLRWKVGQ